MESNSFTSSFKQFSTSIAWAVIFLILAEIVVRILWNPTIVGLYLYTRYFPTYDYGLVIDEPICFHEDGQFLCQQTEYHDFVETQYFNIAKGKNEYRIFTIGASPSRALLDRPVTPSQGKLWRLPACSDSGSSSRPRGEKPRQTIFAPFANRRVCRMKSPSCPRPLNWTLS